ncbi:MAG TPA: Nif3-like dinuclear metal center hexameric protein [Flavihumibacter sp.]|jgi:dinuclear metal center YbgI/SA1388 family protein
MKIAEITGFLEQLAPPAYQESYDNAGLIAGSPDWTCTGITISLDATLDVILEAAERGHNLVVAHHPIVFSGIKKLNGRNYVEKALIAAIKKDIAIYAIHTNLDNLIDGVNGRIADQLGLKNRRILQPKQHTLKKLAFFVPQAHTEKVLDAVFNAGAGQIGQYSECSFRVNGSGSFRAGDQANPFVGEIGKRHTEPEDRVEIIYPQVLERKVLEALLKNHPYEEVAYDCYPLTNTHPGIGAGLMGELEQERPVKEFLDDLKALFKVPVVRHSPLVKDRIRKVAVCGGAGSFLISSAVHSGADIYITADVKYHEFFDANDQLVIADIGHFETEQYTVDLLYDILAEKFPTFAVFKTGVKTNPVNYHI